MNNTNPLIAAARRISHVLPVGVLSEQELIYIDRQWDVYAGVMNAATPAKICLLLDLAKNQVSEVAIDYAMVVLCVAQHTAGAQARAALIGLIDNYDKFDDAARNAHFMRIILACIDRGDTLKFADTVDYGFLRRVVSHIAAKFPHILKMSFMLRRSRGKITPRFTADDLLEWY